MISMKKKHEPIKKAQIRGGSMKADRVDGQSFGLKYTILNIQNVPENIRDEFEDSVHDAFQTETFGVEIDWDAQTYLIIDRPIEASEGGMISLSIESESGADGGYLHVGGFREVE